MIWVIGSTGMLGTELMDTLRRTGLPFVGTDKNVDILDQEAITAFANARDIHWIVNCAAYTAVDKAEEDVARCRELNTEAPANIARLANRIGASLIHISTDYVFDGKGTRPYRENDAIGPTGVYGRTKAEGERAALEACPRTVIIRTAWLYGKYGLNFVATMLRLMNERETIGVVSDQRGTPTWARDLATAIVTVLQHPTVEFGVFHYSSAGETTWYDFALEIKRLGADLGLLKRDCTVNALTTDLYPTRADRPLYSVLSTEKIKTVYGTAVPDWKESLKRYIEEDLVVKVN